MGNIDVVVYAVILLLGVASFAFYLKTPDSPFDTSYVDPARSLVEHGSYQFDFLPETMFPPGFPMILASVEKLAGERPAIPYHVIAVFATLGLLVTYELLRRAEGRAVAAASCLLLTTSQSFFSFVTEMVFSEMPYFFFSWLVLLLAWKIDRSKPGLAQVGRVLLLGIALASAILVRSVGLTLSIGLCIWIMIALLKDRRVFRSRFVLFIIPLMMGVGAQVGWSAWAKPREVTEWALPGWPQSYLSQLTLKDGNDPELGYAHLRDVPGRVVSNASARAAEVSQLLLRRETGTGFWSSPLVVGVIILIGLGLFKSLKGGGELFDWYFLCHEALFLVWPWNTETRFVLPVVPLAWLYLWRGGRVVYTFAQERRRTAGLCFLVFGVALSFASADIAIHAGAKPYLPAVAAVLWILLGGVGLLMSGSGLFQSWSWMDRWQDSCHLSQPLCAVPILALSVLMAYGCVLEVGTARYNQHPDLSQGPWYQDIEAAKWIRSHEPADDVVMARKQDLVFHYTQHRVVWFPPISDPQQLMDGMRRYNVKLVLVVSSRRYTIWLPAEQVCFRNLLQAYPSSFKLIYSNSSARIYEVNQQS